MSKRQERTNIKIASPGVNVAVVKNDYDGWKFLILKRAEGESYGGFWGFMTGGKRGEETVAQVVVRELKEETDLKPTSIWATEHLIQFYEPEFDEIWILPLVVAVVEEDVEVKLSDENSEFRWLAHNRAKHLVSWDNLRVSIDKITDELDLFPARNWVEIKA
ncbi:NUDIX domain-containing protein [candidate division GN15 bacterium]|nr:NUDIX domain-containing protein [candidate division GN15 bacterium]